MKCKIIKFKQPKNEDNELFIPSLQDFENMREFEGETFKYIIENYIGILEQAWLLITSNNNRLWKIDTNRHCEYIGKLKFLEKVKSNSLTFDTLRKANVTRLPEFKNSKGLPAHSKEDGSDWSSADWLGAVLGELGEYANVMKKVKRGDLTFEEAKPLIEKELADVMTYLDILAFRVGVDLSKAVEQKFNEVSERVGCSLRIENNEVVRKETPKVKTYAEAYPRNYTLSPPQAIDFAKLGSEELLKEAMKMQENARARNQQKCETSILENYNYDPKNGECGTITNITVQTTNSVINEDVTLSVSVNDKIKISREAFFNKSKEDIDKDLKQINSGCKVKPELIDLEENKSVLENLNILISEDNKIEVLLNRELTGKEFEIAKEACKILKDKVKELNTGTNNFFDLFKQMYHVQWIEENKQYAYPLEVKGTKINRSQIIDIFGLEFQNLNTLKTYTFFQMKEITNGFTRFVFRDYLFDFFSKQLGTKIMGMLINGSKENKIMNPNNMIQFYDDRNILYNFRLVKSSDKNVEISNT